MRVFIYTCLFINRDTVVNKSLINSFIYKKTVYVFEINHSHLGQYKLQYIKYIYGGKFLTLKPNFPRKRCHLMKSF